MKAVVPMAGRGIRFVNAGFEIPKWMIRVYGKTILELSLTSVQQADEVIFVINESQVKDFDLTRFFNGFMKQDYQVHLVGDTGGQAETVYLVRDALKGQEAVIVNCDNVVHVDFSAFRGQCEQAIPCIDSSVTPVEKPESKSYARCDANGTLLEAAEKKIISNQVIAGMFYFRNFDSFVEGYEKMVRDEVRVNNEYYISPLFNYLSGTKVTPVSYFQDLGTPENVMDFVLQREVFSEAFGFTDSLGIDYTRM
ncbi:hypothetical protein ACTL6U_10080 [Rhodovibrionaceae bacterium A322]